MENKRPFIHIIKCNDSMMWYASFVGRSFPLLIESKDEYVVRAADGYSNIILKKDGCIVHLDCKERERVVY